MLGLKRSQPLLAAMLTIAHVASANGQLTPADVAAADTIKVRIDEDLCIPFDASFRGCPIRHTVITRDGTVERTLSRRAVGESIVFVDTIRVAPAVVDSIAREIAATGFDTLEVRPCMQPYMVSDSDHLTITVARGPARRSIRVRMDCSDRNPAFFRIRRSLARVSAETSWKPKLPHPRSAELLVAGCYRLSRGEWMGSTNDRFEPPTEIRLTVAPMTGRFGRLVPGSFAMTPRLPVHVRNSRGFAGWRLSNDTIHLTWGDTFSGIAAHLIERRGAGGTGTHEGTAQVHTDRNIIGIDVPPKPSFQLTASRIPCRE